MSKIRDSGHEREKGRTGKEIKEEDRKTKENPIGSKGSANLFGQNIENLLKHPHLIQESAVGGTKLS